MGSGGSVVAWSWIYGGAPRRLEVGGVGGVEAGHGNAQWAVPEDTRR